MRCHTFICCTSGCLNWRSLRRKNENLVIHFSAPFRLVMIKGEKKNRIKFLQAQEGAEVGLVYIPKNKPFNKWMFSLLPHMENSQVSRNLS